MLESMIIEKKDTHTDGHLLDRYTKSSPCEPSAALMHTLLRLLLQYELGQPCFLRLICPKNEDRKRLSDFNC